MEAKNKMSEYEKRYQRIKWSGVIGILVCGIIIGILVNAVTKNPDAAGLSAAVVIAVGGIILVYAARQMRMKHCIIVRDERLVNLQYRAITKTMKIFLLSAMILCFGVWFAGLLGIGNFDVAVPFTEVMAYVICAILCIYLAIYFYYQRKM